MMVDLNTGTHRDYEEWKHQPLQTEPVRDPFFLGNFRQSYQSSTETPPYYDWSIREIPKRSPLCWRENPPNSDYHKNYALDDAIFLDTVFRRLYEGSATFRAMLSLSPHVARTASSIWESKDFLAEYQFPFREVDITYDLATAHDLQAAPLAVIAHEYRHRYQESIKAAFSLTAPLELYYFFALCLAAEADAMCFGLVCAYEVLLHEGHSPKNAQKILLSEKDITDSDLTSSFVDSVQRHPEGILTGAFSKAVTDTFLTSPNSPIENYLRTYSGIYSGHMGHSLRFAEAMRNNPLLNLTMKTAIINDDGNMVISTPDKAIPTEHIFLNSFNRLKSLPYSDANGNLTERPLYMRPFQGKHFLDALSGPG